MKKVLVYISLFIGISVLAACLKGKIPQEVIIPEAYIDSSYLNLFRQTSGLIAGEGTTSLTLSDGRTLWLFGNSHLDDYVVSTGKIPCTVNAHNAAMICDNSMTMATLNIGTNDFIPSNETGRWFSPLHAYQYVDTVFIFAKKSGGLLNTRTYVAKFHFPDLNFIKVDSFAMNNTIYGYSVFVDKSVGFGYVYGLYQPSILSENGMYLARFPLNSLHDNWQYYSNTTETWVDPPSSSSPIAQVPGENFSMQKVGKKYVLLTQSSGKSCNHGNEIYAQTSAYPYGNFLNYHLVHTLEPELGGDSPAAYGISLHPQYINANNEILVTTAINGFLPCAATCVAGFDNPDYFRIRTLRIPLKKIDAAY